MYKTPNRLKFEKKKNLTKKLKFTTQFMTYPNGVVVVYLQLEFNAKMRKVLSQAVKYPAAMNLVG